MTAPHVTIAPVARAASENDRDSFVAMSKRAMGVAGMPKKIMPHDVVYISPCTGARNLLIASIRLGLTLALSGAQHRRRSGLSVLCVHDEQLVSRLRRIVHREPPRGRKSPRSLQALFLELSRDEHTCHVVCLLLRS